jgi:ribosomal protein S27E
VAKRDHQRWRDWRIDEASGRSIRADDKRGRPGKPKKQRARNGWWWTLAAREAECKGCGKQLLNQKVAYHHQTREILCPDCAQAQCVSEMCQPSRRLLKVGS